MKCTSGMLLANGTRKERGYTSPTTSPLLHSESRDAVHKFTCSNHPMCHTRGPSLNRLKGYHRDIGTITGPFQTENAVAGGGGGGGGVNYANSCSKLSRTPSQGWIQYQISGSYWCHSSCCATMDDQRLFASWLRSTRLILFLISCMNERSELLITSRWTYVTETTSYFWLQRPR